MNACMQVYMYYNTYIACKDMYIHMKYMYRHKIHVPTVSQPSVYDLV